MFDFKWATSLLFPKTKEPESEEKPPRSRIFNDPIGWGDLEAPPCKPPKQEKKPYYRVDFYDFRGDKPYWAKGFYQSIKYSIRLLAWSYWSTHDFCDITIEYMTEEEFDNLPDFKEPI